MLIHRVLYSSLFVRFWARLSLLLVLGSLFSGLSHGDFLMRGLAVQPDNLDPQRFLGTPEASVLKDLFEGLVIQAEDGRPVPGMAERWEVSDDGLAWTFHLRNGLKWSDGSDLTAHDFLYSFRRLANPETRSQYRWYLYLATVENSVKVGQGELSPDKLGVSAPDDHTLIITLQEPRSWIPALMTFPAFLPVSKQAVENCRAPWDEDIGCTVSNGPYQLSGVAQGGVFLIKNGFYRETNESAEMTGDGARQPDSVLWKIFGTVLDEAEAFKSGDLDISSPVPVDFHRVMPASSMPGESSTKQLTTSYMIFNPHTPQLTPEVRKALASMIDRQAVYPGTGVGEQAWTLIPPWTKGYAFKRSDWSLQPQYQHDQSAREALEQAGINEQNPLILTLLTIGFESYRPVADSIVVQWRRLPGINVNIESVGWEEYISRINKGDYQILLGAWLAAFNDPAAFLLLGGHTNSVYPPGLFGAEYDDGLAELMSCKSVETLPGLYWDFEQKMLKQNIIVPLKHIHTVQWVQPRVKGFFMKNPEGWISSSKLKVLPREEPATIEASDELCPDWFER